MANIANLNDSDKLKIFETPVPASLLPFLDEKGVKYKKTNQKSMLTNVVYIEIELTTGIDITTIIYATLDLAAHEQYVSVRNYCNKSFNQIL